MSKGLKVRELMEQLRGQDPEAHVFFSYNYGDRAQTVVAKAVATVDELQIKHSEYFQAYVVAEDEEEGNYETGVVISDG